LLTSAADVDAVTAVTGSISTVALSEGTDVETTDIGAATDIIGVGAAVDPDGIADVMPGAVAEMESLEKSGLRLLGGAEAMRAGSGLEEFDPGG